MKTLSRDQIAVRKEKAVHFVRDVLGDPGRAGEIEDESVEDYAERRHFKILNPERRNTMAKKNPNTSTMTKTELQDYVADLEDQLDAVYDIVCPDEDSDEDDSNDDTDEDSDEDDSGSDEDEEDAGQD